MFKQKLIQVFIVSLTVICSIGHAQNLEKLDVTLRQAMFMAEEQNTPLKSVQVTFIAAMDSQLSEDQIRNLFESLGLQARSVIFGEITIVTGKGSLEAVLSLSDEETLTMIEGSHILFPEPSISVGN
jgi:hypothetical protein